MLIKHKTFKSPQKLVYLDLNSILGDKPKNKNKIKLKSSHINIVQRTFHEKGHKTPSLVITFIHRLVWPSLFLK